MRLLPAVLLAVVTSWTASGQTYTISTIAGGGVAPSAPLDYGGGVAVDTKGNVFFTKNNTILRLDTITGSLTPVAGNGTAGFSGDDGPAASAQLNNPLGVAVDSAGNLYVADTLNNRVRKVANGVITTVAGSDQYGFSGDNGPASGSRLNGPYCVAVDSAGNLFIADSNNNRVRKVSNGVITTVAGGGANGLGDNGPAIDAQLSVPFGLAVDKSGNLYIADTFHARVRKVSNGVITTVAGNGTFGSFSGDNGPAIDAGFSRLGEVAIDTSGNLYIADTDNNRIRRVSGGVITTVAGNGTRGYSGDGGPAVSAQLSAPLGVAVDSAGNLYIDAGNIRRVSGGVIITVAGPGTLFSGDNGPATSAQLNYPFGVAVDSTGNVYIADTQNHRVRKVSNGVITTVAGNGVPGFSGDNGPAASAQLNYPFGVAVDSAGSLYIGDTFNNRVRKVANGVITTVAGNGVPGFSGDNGPASSALLNDPRGVAVDSAGNLFVADSANYRIREISGSIIFTVAGNGTAGFSGDNGPPTSAQLNEPQGVAVDSAGNLYIADYSNYRIRKVSGGVITTIATTMEQAYGVAVDSAGSVYVTDTFYHRILKLSGGGLATVAGGSPGFGIIGIGDNGPATKAALQFPCGVAVDSVGNVYVADTYNNRIRLLKPDPIAITRGGIVPVYSSVAVVQSGSWVSIFGSSMSSGTFIWKGDFPTSLGGTSVTIDNKPAYLWYVSPTQINLQVPDDTATGPVSVVVTSPSATATSTVTLAQFAPSFSLFDRFRHVTGEIVMPGTGAYGGGTYDLLAPPNAYYGARPVKAGETLILYGVGFGPTTPPVPAGKIFSGAAPTNSPVTVTIAGVNANVAFAGITQAGLYQINVTVPNVPSGDQPIQATVNGVQTPPGTLVPIQFQ